MKKLILSLFMVAICGLAHAANAVEIPKVAEPTQGDPITLCCSTSGGVACGCGETIEEACTSLCFSLGGVNC